MRRAELIGAQINMVQRQLHHMGKHLPVRVSLLILMIMIIIYLEDVRVSNSSSICNKNKQTKSQETSVRLPKENI